MIGIFFNDANNKKSENYVRKYQLNIRIFYFRHT